MELHHWQVCEQLPASSPQMPGDANGTGCLFRHSAAFSRELTCLCCSLATLATATSLKKLAMVQMDFNHLSGNLSAACSLGSRMKLQQLSLGSNAINGSIPACLTNSSALVELRLDNNKLSGSIGALAANSSLVYLTAGSQVRSRACAARWHHGCSLRKQRLSAT